MRIFKRKSNMFSMILLLCVFLISVHEYQSQNTSSFWTEAKSGKKKGKGKKKEVARTPSERRPSGIDP